MTLIALNKRLQTLTVVLLVTCFATTCRANLSELKQRQQRLDAALKKVGPALVAVEDRLGAGSGAVVSPDGIVLTASHVVESAHRVSQRIRVRFSDGSVYSAKALGMNRTADAAMLKITEPYRGGGDFPHVELGESSKLKKGEWCFALGHPGGMRKDRPAPVRLGRVLSVGHHTVVSDCAIVLGDSGGPLFDLSGKLIGIHSMITEVIVENRHIAVDVFRRDGDRMEAGDRWGRLSANDRDIASTDYFGTSLMWSSFSAEVFSVREGSPAYDAGLRTGDVLKSINRQQFADPLGLNTLMEQLNEGQEVPVQYVRRGITRTARVKIGDYPSDQEITRIHNERKTLSGVAADRYEKFKVEQGAQLTSNRHVGKYEKRSPAEVRKFNSVVRGALDSVVEFRVPGESLAMGIIMSRDGDILTKASEIEDEPDARCLLPDGRSMRYEIENIDRINDLALVKVSVTNLRPMIWSQQEPPEPGRMIITTDSRGAALLPGVVSVKSRKLPAAKRGFLGVRMRQRYRDSPVVIEEVIEGGAAKRSGVKVGDKVVSINRELIRDMQQMGEKVSNIVPNSKVSIVVDRDGVRRTIDVRLTPRFLADEREGEVFLSRYTDKKNQGKYASIHNSGYPDVIQHDTDIFPNQCGGPMYDLSGKAVGMNIARSSRVVSYALPTRAVVKAYEELKK